MELGADLWRRLNDSPEARQDLADLFDAASRVGKRLARVAPRMLPRVTRMLMKV